MSAGFCIFKKFETHYREDIENGRYEVEPDCTKFYGIPITTNPEIPTEAPRYRGADRDPVEPISFETWQMFTECGRPVLYNKATQFLSELEEYKVVNDKWITSMDDILRAWELLDNKDDYEIIFARKDNDKTPTPPYSTLLGWDAADFDGDSFSCICDALFLPKWHGSDKEGILFSKHFDSLNANGIFDSREEAYDYLKYYLSFDWTERSDTFTAIEIFSITPPVEKTGTTGIPAG